MKFIEIIEDEVKVAEIVEAARTSMGMDISETDLLNIEHFSNRVASLMEYRQRLHQYIKDRMHSCAPSLSALIGEQVFISSNVLNFLGWRSFDLPRWQFDEFGQISSIDHSDTWGREGFVPSAKNTM